MLCNKLLMPASSVRTSRWAARLKQRWRPTVKIASFTLPCCFFPCKCVLEERARDCFACTFLISRTCHRPFSEFLLRMSQVPLYVRRAPVRIPSPPQERCPPRHTSSLERLKAKVEPLSPQVTVDCRFLADWSSALFRGRSST